MSAASPNVVLADDREAKRLEVHKKTRLCKFFTMGACTRGASCAFAHGPDQLRDQPDYSKTRLCADFVELGKCVEGKACKFAHSKSELRPGSAAKVGRPARTSNHAAKQTENEAEQAMRVLQTLRAQRALHEQAALKLMLQSACASAAAKVSKATCKEPTEKPTEKDVECCSQGNSFSRQTTWEGMETASAGFSRDSSAASASDNIVSDSTTLPDPCDGVELRVKNTFLEVKDETEQETAPLRKVQSLPLLAGVP
ncbi:Zfp36 [Symbiodinium natans]|uniref:Zfp36 protein n=1 Tax=Symbiodinium natans TaxID=878477 RepID=A0A812LGR3_9DINO|nr:Zfp36 [Symbiodinium natans]CAE7246403.1 Zfp36 [Symbiodinium natans]CAE7246405.1 Zfp36 [Symbiodinium natans]